MKRLYLIGGPPGIGKSTVAWLIAEKFGGVLREADQYFVNDNDQYVWDPTKIRDAHAWCQQEVQEWMQVECETIVVANTFSQRWERQPYIDMAQKHKYEVVWMDMHALGELTPAKLAEYNVHNVPYGVIERMINRHA